MRLQVYSVLDLAVRAYLNPFMARTRGEAIRNFAAAVNGGQNDFKRNAADYTLYYLGDYEDTEGVYYMAQPGPEKVLTALESIEDDQLFPPARKEA